MAQAALFADFSKVQEKEAANISPLMAQYLRIKEENPDSLLFFRLGDFYELFFADAVAASKSLDIALTKRGKHQGEDIPMCGVPWHQADGYIARLIKQGFRVAICDQVPNPDPKSKLIERKVVRIITPGTVTEENLLDAKRYNYILSLTQLSGSTAIAWLDVTAGSIFSEEIAAEDLPNYLARLDPQEILLSEKIEQELYAKDYFDPYKKRCHSLPQSRFDAGSANDYLCRLYSVASLDAFGAFSRAEIAAMGSLLDYVQLTQQGKLPQISAPRRLLPGDYVQIDAASARNLELRRKLSGEYEGSLLSVIDCTVTGAGARKLESYLLSPLKNAGAVNARLDAVEYFLRHEKRAAFRDHLRGSPDIERAASRLALQRGSPRDLAALREGLKAARHLQDALRAGRDAPQLTQEAVRAIGNYDTLIDELTKALHDELPHFARDGNFIRKGYAAELDHIKEMRDESRRLIVNLQQRYVMQTGIAALKIRHNNILGYYIEVPPKSADKMGAAFIHRQSLATAARFTTPELSEMEQKLSKAAEQALAMELEIFGKLTAMAAAHGDTIRKCADALSSLDLFMALAELAETQNYARPIVNDTLHFKVEAGRHPVVEAALLKSGQKFMPNDCNLADEAGGKLWLLTGPNMAGKSTYLRQNALIAILAQMGSFVPAASAEIGLVDKIFSRVGAADDLARGQSTFMVEMVETAAILNQAGESSLVILDEIGRGTATFDGLSIAWATLEHLHNTNKCRGIFATHYHELTELQKTLPHLSCHTMKVREWEDQIIFLHEVAEGNADRSYGIHVAKLAGLPPAVISRAAEVLESLEAGNAAQAKIPPAAKKATPAAKQSDVEKTLAAINPDELSPKEALEALYALKKKSAL